MSSWHPAARQETNTMDMTPFHIELLQLVQDEQRRRSSRRGPQVRMTRPRRRFRRD
jgi:hypothetical protein